MKNKLIALGTLVLLILGLVLPAMANHGSPAPNGNCPDTKVDGGDVVQSFVPDAGTHLCIKGSNVIVFVTADGTSTIKQLLGALNDNGKLKDVSHYTIIQGPTTTQPKEETTVPEEETTIPEEETTVPDTTVPEDTTTVAPPGTPPSQAPPAGPPAITELPFTGPTDYLAEFLAGAILIAAGVAVLVFAHVRGRR